MDAIYERAIELFKKADFDGNGIIDFGEWCTATINLTELLISKNLKMAYDFFANDEN